MLYEVLPLKVFRQDSHILTYDSTEEYRPGDIVLVPIGKSTTTAIVIRSVKHTTFQTKSIIKSISVNSLPPHITASIFWLASYYSLSPNTAAKLFLPSNITSSLSIKSKHPSPNNSIDRPSDPSSRPSSLLTTPIHSSSNIPIDSLSSTITFPPQLPLSPHQTQALISIKASSASTHLLHGITGAGKTHIYYEIARQNFQNHKSTIILVPEISLTSQIVQFFTTSFDQDTVLLMHSNLTPKTRREIWYELLNSQKTTPYIIIGTRSALTLPVQNLQTIIIDEAHEPAYTQESSPKYSAIRLASFISNFLATKQNSSTIKNQTLATKQSVTRTTPHIAKQNSSAITLQSPITLLGTATPLVQDYYLASQKSALTTLDKKAKDTAIPPQIHLIDLKNRANFTKNHYFSDALLKEIKHNLENHHQTLIFHNRRGSAPLTICSHCGWQATCPHCFLPLTLHDDSFELVCHTCGYHTHVPTSCPNCGHPDIIHKGFGTKLLENQLKTIFKTAKIARFDADNKKSETIAENFDLVKNGDIDILIGTQTIAKGLDLPNLATVAVVQADSGLSLPDFSAPERTYHLLTQVIGRVGRGHIKNTNVFIQTYQPDHPVITAAIANNYQNFYNFLLNERKKGFFPPFSYLAKFSITFKTEQTTIKHAQLLHSSLSDLIKSSKKSHFSLTPPLPAFHEHSTSGFTWFILLKSSSRTELLKTINSLSQKTLAKVSIWLDPPSLL